MNIQAILDCIEYASTTGDAEPAMEQLSRLQAVVNTANIVVDYVLPFVKDFVGVASSARPCLGDLENLEKALKAVQE